MNRPTRKLCLNRETVRHLTADDLRNVGGGIATLYQTCLCPAELKQELTLNATCINCGTSLICP